MSSVQALSGLGQDDGPLDKHKFVAYQASWPPSHRDDEALGGHR